MIFLVTVREMTLDQQLAFLVNAETRSKAKSLVQRHCQERGYEISVYLHTHAINLELQELVRIDSLMEVE